MVKHTQTIRRLLPTNYLSVFDHFVGLAFKGFVPARIIVGCSPHCKIPSNHELDFNLNKTSSGFAE